MLLTKKSLPPDYYLTHGRLKPVGRYSQCWILDVNKGVLVNVFAHISKIKVKFSNLPGLYIFHSQKKARMAYHEWEKSGKMPEK